MEQRTQKTGEAQTLRKFTCGSIPMAAGACPDIAVRDLAMAIGAFSLSKPSGIVNNQK